MSYHPCFLYNNFWFTPSFNYIVGSKGQNLEFWTIFSTQICHFGVTYVEGFVHQLWYMTGYQLFMCIVMGDTCGAGNAHSFRNTWFQSLWGVHDFTHSLYIHYRICQSWDYVSLSQTYCMHYVVILSYLDISVQLFDYTIWLLEYHYCLPSITSQII